MRTHPIDRKTPCVIRRKVSIPSDKKTTLKIVASHHLTGDWQLIVRANGKQLASQIVGSKTAKQGWQELVIDLTPLAGKTATLELENRANGWRNEWAYWNRVEIVSE